MEDLIACCKQSAIEGMEYFLNTFSFVPDDKLTWTPTPTAKPAIRIAAHTALYAGRFAIMIKNFKNPAGYDMPGWKARRDAAAASITSRTEVESTFRKGTEELIAVLNSLSPEALGPTVDSGLGCSIIDLINQPGMHAMCHAAQIDYLQTCWGDQEVHF